MTRSIRHLDGRFRILIFDARIKECFRAWRLAGPIPLCNRDSRTTKGSAGSLDTPEELPSDMIPLTIVTLPLAFFLLLPFDLMLFLAADFPLTKPLDWDTLRVPTEEGEATISVRGDPGIVTWTVGERGYQLWRKELISPHWACVKSMQLTHEFNLEQLLHNGQIAWLSHSRCGRKELQSSHRGNPLWEDILEKAKNLLSKELAPEISKDK